MFRSSLVRSLGFATPAGMVIAGVLSLVAVAAHAQECVPPPPDLIGWWPGDGDAEDIIGANDGVLVGNATFAPGKVGQAFSFNGTTDYVDLPGTFGGGPEATIDAWVNTNAVTLGFQAVVSSTASGDFIHFQLKENPPGNNAAYVGGGPSPFVVLLPLITESPTNTWRHIAISVKSGDSRLYVDGVEVGSDTLTFTTITPTSDLLIGAGFATSRFFNGLIDEVEIFNRALSASEIQSIFNAGSAGKCKTEVPTVSESGVLIMVLLLLTITTAVLLWRRRSAA